MLSCTLLMFVFLLTFDKQKGEIQHDRKHIFIEFPDFSQYLITHTTKSPLLMMCLPVDSSILLPVKR